MRDHPTIALTADAIQSATGKPFPLRRLAGWCAVVAAAALSCATCAPAAAAGKGRALVDACFAASAIGWRPNEKKPLKGDRRFDAPEPQRPLTPFATVPPHLRGAIRRVKLPAGRKLIALTFDMCEQTGEIAGYDGEIIDYLRREGIKATLFIGGKWMRSHEERTRQLMVDPLFEIANHASAHRNLRLLLGQRLDNEILGPQRAYEAIRADFATNQCVAGAREAWRQVPERMSLFRFPFGACNQAALDAVNDAGLLAIQWDVSLGDPTPAQSAREIAREMMTSTKPGSIIIGHANGRGFNTAQALPLAIPKLKAQGYQFVTVGELIAAGTPEVVGSCYNSRPGDTDRYDNLATAFRSKLTPRPGGVAASTLGTVEPSATRPPVGAASTPPRRSPARAKPAKTPDWTTTTHPP